MEDRKINLLIADYEVPLLLKAKMSDNKTGL